MYKLVNYFILLLLVFISGCGIEDSISIKDDGDIKFKRVIYFNEEKNIAKEYDIFDTKAGIIFKDKSLNFMSTKSIIVLNMIKEYKKNIQKNYNDKVKNLQIYDSSIDSNHPSYTIEATFADISTFNTIMNFNNKLYSYNTFYNIIKSIYIADIKVLGLFQMTKKDQKIYNSLIKLLEKEQNYKLVYFSYFIIPLPSKITIEKNGKESKITISKDLWSHVTKQEIGLNSNKIFIKNVTLKDIALSKTMYGPNYQIFYKINFKSKKILSNTYNLKITNNKLSWTIKNILKDTKKKLIIYYEDNNKINKVLNKFINIIN